MNHRFLQIFPKTEDTQNSFVFKIYKRIKIPNLLFLNTKQFSAFPKIVDETKKAVDTLY